MEHVLLIAQQATEVVKTGPVAAAPLLKVATILVAGIVGGEIFAKLKLPKVTGWIGTGIFLRMLSLPAIATFMHSSLPEPVANFLSTLMDGFVARPETHSYFSPIANLVLSYITFTVGAALYLPNMRNAFKRIGLLLCFEAIITPTIVALTMFFIGRMFVGDSMSLTIALLLAAIAIAGAPGTTVLVVQEARAAGLLSRTLIGAVCLIDMVAVGVFVFMNSFVSSDSADIGSAVLMVLKEFGLSFLIGTLCAVISKLLIRTIVSPAFVGPLMVAVIMAAWGGAAFCGVNEILSAAFAGIMVSNLQHDNVRSAEAYLSAIGGVLFAIFYTFAGMKLDFTKVPTAAALVALFFLSRLLGKVISSYTAMSIAGVTDRVRNYLGLALLPHGGVAVGLIMLIGAQNRFDADTIETITTVGLSALAINQLLGPSATRFCLGRADEDHKDRPRLLDFLKEQSITVDLTGESKEEVVNTLATMLYSTNKLPITQEEFVTRVLRREVDETTCLGEGLMIPHAIIEEPEQETEITGVLGISSEGIDLGAPDGPVHAVLLLATPEHDRKRHLEVLAAFATAITRDVNMREQLYHARSAAHAYEVLHHEEAEDLNYFLEDAIERAGIRDDN
ncbi:cation:proton antiporter domain-containing protein [Mariniblastus fucicola]|uniref:PTS system fructose-specific EIIABC component n=1 Tax=Mariniblastus fucicola TaxID=980251 RepID=A0A5B9PMP1_9BACT|nr:cation:proton antiporter [Mariniblastus fucicola]QEG23851.1 PTS system fructose-specific EIIABC component [Mariniblastus fucicola]